MGNAMRRDMSGHKTISHLNGGKAEGDALSRGRLKIFVGYAAGVGKTYAMLEAARQRALEGVDVLVGCADTHGRPELDALAAGLSTVQHGQVTSCANVAADAELDVDSIVTIRPQLVLVDDLAHSNRGGSRHRKRFQDVYDLLDAGIDVYTTLNIQNLESLNDVVARITGVVEVETVPDRVLDEADEIEVVDLAIDDLRKRLAEGKIRILAQADDVMEKFFRPGNLTALRELAFRHAAERADSRMRAYMQQHDIPGPWPAHERLLVCVSSSPLSERLVRTGARLADKMNAPWVAVHVEKSGKPLLADAGLDAVAHTLRLAETLGAKVATIPGNDVIEAIVDYARSHNVTKIVAGKSLQPRWIELFRGSLVDQLIRKSQGIDVYVINSGAESRRKPYAPQINPVWSQYWLATALVTAITLVALPIRGWVEPTNLVMVYLLGVVMAALRWERRVAAWVSLLSVLAFDIFYVPPYNTLAVSDAQYVLTFAGLLAVSLVIGTLASQAREQASAALRRENQTVALYELSRDLSTAISLDDIVLTVADHVEAILGKQAFLWLRGEDGLILHGRSGTLSPSSELHATATWTLRHGLPAGTSTDTHASAASYHVPLIQNDTVLGVLSIDLGDTTFSREHKRLIEAFANQASLAIVRVHLSEEAQHARILQETERLQTTLLNSLSHDLRTPLASVIGALSSLRDDAEHLNEAARTDLLDTAADEAERMNRLVNNLLDMSRLEFGAVRLKREICDIQDLIGVVLSQLGRRLQQHKIQIDLPEHLPFVSIDFVLMVQAVANLLENAAKYSLPGTPIVVRVRASTTELHIDVKDSGAGVPPALLPRVFDKFVRGENVGAFGGAGLGLPIAKAVVEIHGGQIRMENCADGGAMVSILLPLSPASSDWIPRNA